MSRSQKRKRHIGKIMSKKARGIATDNLNRINGTFKKIAKAKKALTARAQITEENPNA